ncbi:MAG TPA: nuclear transport factor 2 family protein [Terriglobales bacterium]|nr:nuclear transport factor 2 family protein [Terriglobales bacterium]
MADQSALDVVVAYTDAWAGKDLVTATGYLADDVVFDGPFAHYESAEPLVQGLARFVAQIAPVWKQLAALARGEQVMLMYEVFLPSGKPLRTAEHFNVRDGRIRSETLVFDSLALHAARAEAQAGQA